MRVFNISNHKCGTSSLHEAMKILGFQSYHYEHLHGLLFPYLEGRLRAEAIFEEDNTAFNDMPIPIMYRELYEMFPSEKFLFVKRDRTTWLSSLRRHVMGPCEGSRYPVHTIFYGYPLDGNNFDDATCLRAYERFSKDVVKFFKGKPNFLYMEFEKLEWQPLCEFLGKPVPASPFPWANRAP